MLSDTADYGLCHFIWWGLGRDCAPPRKNDILLQKLRILVYSECKYPVYNSMERMWKQSPKQSVYDIRLYTKKPATKNYTEL